MVHRLVNLAVWGLAMFAGMAPHWAGADPGASSSSDPAFNALLIDGRTVSGQIVSLDQRAVKLRSAEGAVHELPLDRLVKLTRDVPVAPPPPDRSHVLLPEGDCLTRVVIGASTETSLEVQSDALGKLLIPLDCLLGLILTAPDQTSDLDGLWDRIRIEPRTREVVWLANGDRLSGEFLALDDRQIKIQVEGKPVDVDRSGVIAVGFDPGLVNYPRPKSDFLELTLKDGTRLGVALAKLEEGNVVATTRFGQTVQFAQSELARVHARSKTVVYLSELEPSRTEYRSYVGPTRTYRFDRTVDGHVFQLGGQTFDRGVGTQSRTLIAYILKPGDKRFQASVGVDERAGPLGSVVFRVFLDGKEKFKTPPMTDHDPPQTIDLDLKGAKNMILDTAFGDRGDVRDLADWIEARIIR
jgi:NPCBM/NEW2 domain